MDAGRDYSFLGYLGRGSTFPHPLSRDEERECVRRARQGDRSARNVLVEHNMRLVAHVVKKYENSGVDLEDLISVGSVGLIKSIDTYDPQRGTRLATYAARCIENEILMFLRSLKKLRREVSLEEPIGVDSDGNEISFADVLGSDPEAVPEAVNTRAELDRLREKLETLPPRERRVLQLRYGLLNGMERTQREIGRLLGVSRSYVSRLEKRALRAMAALMRPGC